MHCFCVKTVDHTRS